MSAPSGKLTPLSLVRVMRLTNEQIQVILRVVAETTSRGARVHLYGSRLDDARRGGDVDLLVLSDPAPTLLQRAEIKNRLEDALGLPVDVLGAPLGRPDDEQSAFVQIALARSQLLNEQ